MEGEESALQLALRLPRCDSPSSSFHSQPHSPTWPAGGGKISAPRQSSRSTTPPSDLSWMCVPSAVVEGRPEVDVIVTQGLPMGI